MFSTGDHIGKDFSALTVLVITKRTLSKTEPELNCEHVFSWKRTTDVADLLLVPLQTDKGSCIILHYKYYFAL